jgi:hypothetical protein
MRNLTSILSAITLCVLIAGCGLTPVYSTNNNNTGAASQLRLTEISNIPEKTGVDLRNELVDRMHLDGTPYNARYKLSVQPVSESSAGLGISKDASVTRYQLRMGTNLELIDMRTKDVLLQRKVSAVTSYNVLDSHFTTLVSEREARMNGIKELAEQILIQLDLYFSSQETRDAARKQDQAANENRP